MDNKLLEAAQTGNVSLLRCLMGENPLLLAEFTLLSPHENLLHIAAKSGQLLFAQEIASKIPELAKEVNQDGFRPIDIASALGHVEIVGHLVSVVPGVSRMKGRDGRAALHYAALYGRIEVIDVLLSDSPESVKDLSALHESALHLAVKNCQFDALRKLVRWAQNKGFGEVLNWRDKDGNTILHLAVIQRQLQSVEVILNGSSNSINISVELNALNSKGMTAMDIAHLLPHNPIDDVPSRMVRILLSAGAHSTKTPITIAAAAPSPPPSSSNIDQEVEMKKDLFKYVSFQPDRDSLSDLRNGLLVVCALIATITFDKGLDPPDYYKKSHGSSRTYIFYFFVNSLGFTTSITVIGYLIEGFPFQIELQVAIVSMLFAYGSGIASYAEGYVHVIILATAFFLPYWMRWIPAGIKKMRNKQSQQSSSPNLEAAVQLGEL